MPADLTTKNDFDPRARYFANPDAVFRAMGEDMVIVDEKRGRVVVLNGPAKQVLDGVLAGLTRTGIVRRMRKCYVFDNKVDLTETVDRTQRELAAAGVIVASRPFVNPKVSVRDLATSLKEMDLINSTVSQYE